MCSVDEARQFAEMLQPLILALIRFQFLVFACYCLHRIIRRILR
jgi:hypothetical protein